MNDKLMQKLGAGLMAVLVALSVKQANAQELEREESQEDSPPLVAVVEDVLIERDGGDGEDGGGQDGKEWQAQRRVRIEKHEAEGEGEGGADRHKEEVIIRREGRQRGQGKPGKRIEIHQDQVVEFEPGEHGPDSEPKMKRLPQIKDKIIRKQRGEARGEHPGERPSKRHFDPAEPGPGKRVERFEWEPGKVERRVERRQIGQMEKPEIRPFPGKQRDIIVRRGPGQREMWFSPGPMIPRHFEAEIEWETDWPNHDSGGRLGHLEQAIHHLHEAGLPQPAQRLERKLDRIAQRSGDKQETLARTRRELAELKAELQQLRREIGALRQNKREKNPDHPDHR